MTQTALITGATGLLGRQVQKAFERASWRAVGTGFSRAKPPDILKVNIQDTSEVEKALDEVKPTVVVHCAANRSPDLVDADPAAARALNVKATQFLASATFARKILLLYISTDYVFAGVPGDSPYEADHKPSPPNIYGQTKLDGENAVLSETQHSGWGIALRVPVLYGQAVSSKESAINVLLDAVHKAQQAGAKVNMDDWALRYPTNTEDVGRVCVDIAKKYLSADDKTALPRVLQFSSEDKYTKFQVCVVFAEILGVTLEEMVPNKVGNDPRASVQRPYDTHLSTRALKDLGIDVWTQNFASWWRRELGAYRR